MYRSPNAPSPILVSGTHNVVRGHERASGRRLWEYSLGGFRHTQSAHQLVVHEGVVVGYATRYLDNKYAGVLFVLDCASGRPYWSVDIQPPLLAPRILVDAPHVYFALGEALSAYALADGRLLWRDESVGYLEKDNNWNPTAAPITMATQNGVPPTH